MNVRTGADSRTVVVGFDGRTRTKNLLRVAADEAHHRGATLAIVTVVRPSRGAQPPMTAPSTVDLPVDEVARQQMETAAAAVRERYDQMPVTTHSLAEDDVVKALEPLASAELLVVGTHGQYGRVALQLESVSRALLKAAGCPILVVPEDGPGAPEHEVRAAVVSGVGTHPADAGVVRAAYAESSRRGCDLQVLHAYRDWAANTQEERVRQAGALVADTIKAAELTPGARVEVVLVEDLPAPALCRQASDATLLVIGSRPGSLSGLVLESVSRAILLAAPCPVLVIPREEPRPSAGRPAVELDVVATT